MARVLTLKECRELGIDVRKMGFDEPPLQKEYNNQQVTLTLGGVSRRI